MRIEYSKSDYYNPYAEGLAEIGLSADKLLKEGKYDQCLKKVAEGLAIDRFNILLLINKDAALCVTGKIEEANEIQTKWMSLFDSIQLSGDGSSFESAYQVISIAEEYAVLAIFGLEPTLQTLVEHEGSFYDVITIAKNDDGVKGPIYFNVDIPTKWLHEKLRKNQDRKQADELNVADIRPPVGGVGHREEAAVMNPLGLIFIAAGAFSMLGAICNWDWFVNARKARLTVKILTRNGARVFYCVLGFAIAVLGVLATTGIIDMSSPR
jgi:hypothetical protein